MSQKTALITGITGQDGCILAQFLLDKGYVVHGLRLYSATDDTQRLEMFQDHPNCHLHHGDLTDGTYLLRLLSNIEPDEVYNLGAQSHVSVSFEVPESTANINGLGTLRLLDAIRTLGLNDKTRFYQASSSEMFGNAPAPQDENTPFSPCSPYAAAKLYAYWITKTYRQAYGMFACNGILFNHESPLRGEWFVTRKIAIAVAAIAQNRMTGPLLLGNLDSRRDWGHAHDYVRGMWMMMQHDQPDDFVLATGQSHSVRDFATAAFSVAGMTLRWEGQGPEERGVCTRTNQTLVSIDPTLLRPAEVYNLIGCAEKVRDVLGWTPEISFKSLVTEMVESEMESVQGNVVAFG